MKKRNGQLATLLLAIVMILSFAVTPIFAAGDQTFRDVPESAWYHGYVGMLYGKDIVKGYGTTGEFRPDNKLTREHAAKMIALAAGLAYQGKKADFPDVKKDGEMSPYIAALQDKGAIQGFPDGTFRPLANIQRGHAAKIVALAFGLLEGDLASILNDLPEDADVKTAIEILESNGVVKGYGNTKLFKPEEEISRAEFAKILCIAMVVASIQKAEADPTPANIAVAQTLIDQLPQGQDAPTQSYLQGRLDALEEEEEPGGGTVVPPKPKVDAITITALVIGEPYDGQPLPNFEGVYVELETKTTGAEIYYTLDGSDPSKTNGTKYIGGFAIDTDNPFGETITLMAVAVKGGYTNSEIATLVVKIDAKDPVESFYFKDEFVGWFKEGEERPNFDAVQGEDFHISLITGSVEEGYEVKLTGSIKVFVDEGSLFGHGGPVALLALKYNIPEEFANDEGLTDVGLTWTAPIQSEDGFDDNANAWRKVDTGKYDSLILTSNVFALTENGKLKFAINWNGEQNAGDGYVEYTLDISEVNFVLAEGNVLNETKNTVHRTIQLAIDAADNGDTIFVGDGTYKENVTMGKSLTLIGIASGSEKPVLEGSFTVQSGSADSTIEGMKFSGGLDANNVKQLILKSVDRFTLSDCDFEGMEVSGKKPIAISLDDTSKKVKIVGSKIAGAYYLAIQGKVNELEVKDVTITDCNSGLNIQAGNKLIVTNTDVNVKAISTADNSYGFRYTSNKDSNMSILGGSFIWGKSDGVGDPADDTYHSAIIVRGTAADTADWCSIEGATIQGEVVDITKALDLEHIIETNIFTAPVVVVRGVADHRIVSAPVVNTTQNIGYHTIQDAIANAIDGDTIEVGPGTHEVGKRALPGTNATWGCGLEIGIPNLTLKSMEGSENTIINFSDSVDYGIYISAVGGGAITIEGFTITGRWYGNGIRQKKAAGGQTTPAIHVINNKISTTIARDKLQAVIEVRGDDSLVKGNQIELRSGTYKGNGIQILDARNSVIAGNIILDKGSNGTIMSGAGISFSNTSVSNDMTIEIVDNEITGGLVGIAAGGNKKYSVKIDSNRIDKCHSAGVRVSKNEFIEGFVLTNNNFMELSKSVLLLDSGDGTKLNVDLKAIYESSNNSFPEGHKLFLKDEGNYQSYIGVKD